jgi:protoporphyrinogen oxidase
MAALDRDAMGRFFPHADLTDIVRNMKVPDNRAYNATFTYPEGGAFEYVKAIATEVRPDAIALGEALIGIDLAKRVARTTRRELHFTRLVSSAPFNRLVALAGLSHDPDVFTSNKVLVYNLGFDRKGPRDAHWIYYPARSTVFYRVGFYDNILGSDRMSLYVEIGCRTQDQIDVETTLGRVLEDLRSEGVISDQRLIAWHSVVMDPAYVHITRSSIAEHARLAAELASHGVWSIGRYGAWTYCSIEDNIVQARECVAGFV